MVNGLQTNRWIRALALAKLLFDDEGYFTTYLDEIEHFIKEKGNEYSKYLRTEGRNLNKRGKPSTLLNNIQDFDYRELSR